MDMTIFTSTPFGDNDAMKDFLFANSQAHRDIAQALEKRGLSIDSKPLAEMGNEKDWLHTHADIHQQELIRLGVTEPVDLGEVDLQDEQAYYDWMRSHALLHLYINQALGL